MAQFPLFTGPSDVGELRSYLNELVNALNSPSELTGNVEVDGTLTVDGATTLTGAATLSSTAHIVGAATLDSTAAVAGNFAVATNKFTVAAASGNTLAAGTLNATGDFAVATNKFTVAAATGNIAVAGTENVVGDFSVATSKFNVTAASGNTSIAGTLAATGALSTGANLGTPGTGVTAVEIGDGYNHTTILTVSSVLPAIAGGAALGVGKLLYTLPAGAEVYKTSYMSMAITQIQGHINADTPKVGLGTVIASGAVAVLNGTATFMDLITEQTAANCTGTATVKTVGPTAGIPLVTEAAGSKAVYFNAAATWAASGDAAAILAGTVVIQWQFMH